MNKYTLEIIECVRVYYPTRHIIMVQAEDLRSALDKCFEHLCSGYDSDIPDYATLFYQKEYCMKEWGLDEDSDELLALAYNQCLDDGESSYRIIKGSIYDEKVSEDVEIFNLMDTDVEVLNLKDTGTEEIKQ